MVADSKYRHLVRYGCSACLPWTAEDASSLTAQQSGPATKWKEIKLSLSQRDMITSLPMANIVWLRTTSSMHQMKNLSTFAKGLMSKIRSPLLISYKRWTHQRSLLFWCVTITLAFALNKRYKVKAKVSLDWEPPTASKSMPMVHVVLCKVNSQKSPFLTSSPLSTLFTSLTWAICTQWTTSDKSSNLSRASTKTGNLTCSLALPWFGRSLEAPTSGQTKPPTIKHRGDLSQLARKCLRSKSNQFWQPSLFSI